MTEIALAGRIEEIWLKAEKHKLASGTGNPIYTEQYELCSCCDQVIEKQPISMMQHTKQFERYGFGYPLWFSFLKYCIVLIMVLIASKTANGLYMAANQNYEFCNGESSSAIDSQPNNNDNSKQSVNPLHQNNMSVQQHIDSPDKNQQTLSNQSIINKLHVENAFRKRSNSSQALSSKEFVNKPPYSNLSNKLLSGSGNNSVPQCTSWMVLFSLFQGQKMSQDYFLKTIQFLIHLFALICIRNMILKEQQYYDQRNTLISDYSIIVHHLPSVYGLKRKLLAMFQQEFGIQQGQNSQIKQFIYVFKDKEVDKITQEMNQVEDQILIAQEKDNFEQEDQLRDKIAELEESLQKQKDRVRTEIDQDRIKCNKVIMIMATQGDKASVLYSFKQAKRQKRSFTQYFYDIDDIADQVKQEKINLLMKEAPQPNEILWEHIDESERSRNISTIQGWVLTFLFLALITIVFYYVLLTKTKLFISALEMEENDPNNEQVGRFNLFATFIVYLAIFGVVFFNKFVMGTVLHKFVHLQRHAYTDKENHSFALKYALGMFFTTALMTIAVQAITYQNFYSHKYGVIEEETIMFFVTAFVIPLIWFIHPYNIFKNIKRGKYYGKFMSQKRANKIIEPFPYMLGKRYAQIFEIMWFTFLYSELIPIGSFLILIGLILYYWVDKYNFLRRSAIDERVSGKMAIYGLKSLDATLFLSTAGKLFFSWVIRDQFNYQALIFTIIGIIYLFLPVTSIIWALNGQKYHIDQQSYEQSKKSFRQTYYSLHPIYKHTHQKQILEHRQISIEYYKQDLKKVKLFGTGRGNYRKDSQIQFRKKTNSKPRNSEIVSSRKII